MKFPATLLLCIYTSHTSAFAVAPLINIDASLKANTMSLKVGSSDDIPGIVNGWATISDVDSNGIEAKKTADKYDVTVKPDNTHWLKNVYTPFIGKKFIIKKVEIQKRTPYNTLIQLLVRTTNVRWQVLSDTKGNENPNVVRSFAETVSLLSITRETGIAKMVGWGSDMVVIVTDYKPTFGQDWGILEVVDSSDTELVIKVDQEKKGKFKMFWKLEE